MFIYRELALLILHFFKQVIYNCTSVIFSMWLFKILVCVIRYGLFLTDPDLVTHSMTHIIFNFEIGKKKILRRKKNTCLTHILPVVALNQHYAKKDDNTIMRNTGLFWRKKWVVTKYFVTLCDKKLCNVL